MYIPPSLPLQAQWSFPSERDRLSARFINSPSYKFSQSNRSGPDYIIRQDQTRNFLYLCDARLRLPALAVGIARLEDIFTFVPQRETVNAAFYLEVLRRLKCRIARLRADLKDVVKLHHDNAPQLHGAHLNQLPGSEQHPSGFQALLRSRFSSLRLFLFSRLKRELKGKHWESVENIQTHVTTFLKGIPVEKFQGALHVWQTRLRKCIDAGGDYFEEF
ncbi:hypothetical protein NQ318_009672 [Aromia moschata]|uniref:Uncharacterized protein n=1 Tax=Aromia moschata TaxID=1265417 RepID=A0AAV8XPP5_9CUCU|nr:hypothetical protein NQ318_009672 [Aromia moschata]